MALHILDLPGQQVPLEKLCMKQNGEKHTFTPEIVDAYGKKIEQVRQDRRENPPSQEHDPDNNPILTLDRFSNENSQPTFSIGSVEFGDYAALKELVYENPSDERLLQQFVPFSMIVVLETADGYVPLGFRQGEHLSGRYLSPAGFQEADGPITPNYFRTKCLDEMRVETGINVAGKISYIGMTGDTKDSFLAVAVFHSKTPLKAEKVHKAWEASGARNEHSHFIYLPSGDVVDFMRGDYTGIVNPFSGIRFEQGICVDGPKEIRGGTYQQIENGIGSLVAYASLSKSPEVLRSDVDSLVTAGSLEGVVWRDFSTEQSTHLVSV